LLTASFFLTAQETEMEMPVPEPVTLPSDYDKKVKETDTNWMEKEINKLVGEAVRKSAVVMKKISDTMIVQVVPNYAYVGQEGEEKLGEDLAMILNSGKVKVSSGAKLMNFHYSELLFMKLPFKRRLIDKMIVGADKFPVSIDITFFINVNVLTKKIYNALDNIPGIKPVYNSAKRYYKAQFEGSRLLYLIYIPNMAYEIAYTGNIFEKVLGKYVKEAQFLHEVLKKYEKKVIDDKKLNFDGRYIRGKDIMVDLWFLPAKVNMDKKQAEKVFEEILKHKPAKITGSEKKNG
jgi:hypothetical protein